MNIDLIKPTAAVALADIARTMEGQGLKVIKLQTGDPDFATHPEVIAAGYEAMKNGLTHYSFSQGLPELRKLIAAQYATEINKPLDTSQVVITNGAAGGFFTVMAALIEPGDEVLILEPNWPTVDSLVLLMGGKPVKINSLESTSNIIEALDKNYTASTKALCFNSPNNPTGVVYSQELLNAIVEWAIRKNIYVIADEVYRYLQFEKVHTTSLAYLASYSKYIFIGSFSKKFAMTGWRIGYVISEAQLIKKILKPSQLATTHVAAFTQMAAMKALNSEASMAYCEEMRDEYKCRRDAIVEYCKAKNLEFIFPSGAFYLFIKIPVTTLNDVDFSNQLLNTLHACVVPGSAFGESASGYVRISYANKLEQVMEGLDRIVTLIGQLQAN